MSRKNRYDSRDYNARKEEQQKALQFFKNHKIKATYNSIVCNSYCLVIIISYRLGFQSMIQCVGFESIRPNIVAMGFLSKWSECINEEKKWRIEEYVGIIEDV